MNSLKVNTRNTKSKGEIRSLRLAGNIPGIIYGGTEKNQKVSVLKKTLKSLIEKENFLSNIITLDLDGKSQNVLPKEIKYNVITDEPIHIDFLRVVAGVKIKIDVPVKFELRALDVLHNFYVPQFRGKMDMVPGTVTFYWLTPTREGDFEVLCAEFCGTGHYAMRGRVIVDDEEKYNIWLAEQVTFENMLAKNQEQKTEIKLVKKN